MKTEITTPIALRHALEQAEELLALLKSITPEYAYQAQKLRTTTKYVANVVNNLKSMQARQ